MTDVRRMADLAETLADAGHDAWSIVQELQNAADEAEFGWTGAKLFGSTGGMVPISEAYEVRESVYRLIDDNPRSKSVRKDDLTRALTGETE